jgi:hypothetical protein
MSAVSVVTAAASTMTATTPGEVFPDGIERALLEIAYGPDGDRVTAVRFQRLLGRCSFGSYHDTILPIAKRAAPAP